MAGEKKVANIIYILLVFLVIMFIIFNPFSGYGPRMLAKLSNLVTENIDIANDDAIPSTKVSESFNKLHKLFEIAKNSPDKTCFVSLDGITEEFAGFRFDIVQDGDIMKIQMMKDETMVSYGSLGGLNVCAVYGGNAAGNFYNHWLSGRNSTTGQEYNTFNVLTVSNDGIVIDGDEGYFNIRYLFKADDGLVCFMPTHGYWFVYNCKGGSKGLDDDCAEEFEFNPTIKMCKEGEVNV